VIDSQRTIVVSDESKTCFGKQRHPSFVEARKLVQRRKYRDDGCRVYRCPECNGWHLGRQPPGKGKRHGR